MARKLNPENAPAILFDATEFPADPPSTPPCIAPLKPTPVYDSYWRFAAERQRIFFRRLEQRGQPWTDHPVLRVHKFTNAYRASDRVSEYLIRRVIYRDDLPADPPEVMFRIFLFKLFNRIETWELFERSLGPVTYADFSFKAYDKLLTRAMKQGERIYSTARPTATAEADDRYRFEAQ
jgi:alpha-glutamyl/putrescinyl thymine pyrophosphorylase clade 1